MRGVATTIEARSLMRFFTESCERGKTEAGVSAQTMLALTQSACFFAWRIR